MLFASRLRRTLTDPRSLLATSLIASTLAAFTLGACAKDEAEAPPHLAGKPPASPTPADEAPGSGPNAAKLMAQAKAVFSGPLPARVDDPKAPATEAQIALGKMLYFDARLSKNHDISCNSCHSLTDYGVDVRAPEGQRQVSAGHKSQTGDRNSPTVYNAALHFRQFWDGRAANLTEQAKGPVLNPIEMAMPSEDQVLVALKSIPGYVEAFQKAFPEAPEAVSYENMARAIAAFEGGLITPAPFDEFLAGQADALGEQALRGLGLFIEVGCTTCHMGPALGGSMYQKMGLLKPYETADLGRFKETQVETDKHLFKVPSLRNIEKTGPYLHDGSIATLEEMVRIMAEYQIPRGSLSEAEVADIVAFLKSLTGALPEGYIAQPTLPESGPSTPKPDPA